ncbi:uncharacterized protein AMSG_06899 [Thecamonas trahens ATCC 50062]|uniref:Uncharacterized protein n=1 Tax=Thecamonas trahens ATCC 50062 TaxID=461836 RepID=A0A0L0DGE1_THETB|nr:hypothetical protein AMSG_06899 [Thecamonas trahens ATCC 50062]KNC50408.1 hypothetical protein AMSG_06899 [Thecamonas trahens ATCC 50062]|eukprot:XP_013756950.1 hypothetical protein AMSG_06899 [Thecamonas trahens ATCC 50062]
MRRLTNDKSLWKALCKAAWRRSYWGPSSSAYVTLNESLNNDWKSIYATRTAVDKRWTRGDCRLVTLYGHHRAIDALQFDDAKIVTGGEDGLLVVWDIRSGSAARVHNTFDDMVVALQYDTNGIAVVGLWNGDIRVVDLDSGASLGSLSGHTAGVRALHVVGNTLVSGAFDGELRLWDKSSGACRVAVQAHAVGITALAVEPALGVLATSSLDGSVRLWSGLASVNPIPTPTGTLVCSCTRPASPIWAVALSTDYIVAGCDAGALHVWSPATLAPLGTPLTGHASRVSCIALDGSRLVSGSDDGSVLVWNLETMTLVTSLTMGAAHPVASVRFDDTKIVSAGGEDDPAIRIWDFAYGLDAVDARSTIMAMPSASASLQAPLTALRNRHKVALAHIAAAQSTGELPRDMEYSDTDEYDEPDVDLDPDNSMLLQDMYEYDDHDSDDDSDDNDAAMMAIIDGRF